jgi:hypothetical protein
METDKGRRGTAWNQTQEKERLLLVTDMCTWIPAFIFMSSCACDL